MKLLWYPRQWSWWIWVLTALLLFLALAGRPAALAAALVLSAGQVLFYATALRGWKPYAVQIRLAYLFLLLGLSPPALRFLLWVPALGTVTLVLFGYCLMGRTLSLLPWNRSEPLSLDLLRRAFLTPPVAGRALPLTDVTGCPGGVCALEARAVEYYRSRPDSRPPA